MESPYQIVGGEAIIEAACAGGHEKIALMLLERAADKTKAQLVLGSLDRIVRTNHSIDRKGP